MRVTYVMDEPPRSAAARLRAQLCVSALVCLCRLKSPNARQQPREGPILLWWPMPTNLPPRPKPPYSLWPIFWDATIAIATATMVVEIVASLKWAFS
jgi:hypothetical protein